MADYYVDVNGNISRKKKKKESQSTVENVRGKKPAYSVGLDGTVTRNHVTSLSDSSNSASGSITSQNKGGITVSGNSGNQGTATSGLTGTGLSASETRAQQARITAEENILKQYGTYEQFQQKNAADNKTAAALILRPGAASTMTDTLEKAEQGAYEKLIEDETYRLLSESYYAYEQELDDLGTKQQEKSQAWTEKQRKNLEIIRGLDDETKELLETSIYGYSEADKDVLSGNLFGQADIREGNKKNATKALKKKGYSKDEIESLADTFTRAKNANDAEEWRAEVAEKVNRSALDAAGMSTGSVFANLVSGFGLIPAATAWAEKLVTGEYVPIDTNDPLYRPGEYRDIVRTNVSQNIEDSVDSKAAKKILPMLYNAGMSTADTFTASALGGALGGTAKASEAMSLITMSAGAASSGTQEAFNRTGNTGKALATGTAAGVIEYATEKISLDHAWDIIKNSGSAAGKSWIVNLLAQGAIEGSEETASEFANRIVDDLVNGGMSQYNQNVQQYEDSGKDKKTAEKLATQDFLWQVADSFSTGALAGLMGGGISTALSTKPSKGAQAVIDTEVDSRIVAKEEKTGKKLKMKEKAAIREQVTTDLANGRISIDTIEKTLGGETYEKYRTALEQEETLKKAYEEAGNKTEDGLSYIEKENQRKAYEDAKAKYEEFQKSSNKEELKKQLGREVEELAGNDEFLRESYNERTRRGDAYRIDESVNYSKKEREIVQKATDSKILNNTRATHAFVDLVARLAADKDVSFDFTDNQRLKESGFAIEGKRVNGFVNDGTITINIESNQALDTVVGHEITHVLEGTELYLELQEAAKEYATIKGEYDSRLAELTELYKGVEGANIENELTADLVGEYLFSDPDFVNRLAAKNRNLFQRLFREIRYMAKNATAGSKEAQKLEELKRAFERAYQENNTKAQTKDGNIQYHISSVFSDEVDSVLNGTMESSNQVKARDYTPEYLVKEGAKNLPMLITQNHVKSVIYTEAEAKELGLPTGKNVNYHGLGKELLINAIDSMDNPLEVYKKDGNNFIIVTELVDNRGNTIIVPVRINGKGTYNNVFIDENHITSVYGKKNLQNYLSNNNFEKVDVKKGTALNEGVQYSNISNSLTDSVPQNQQNASENSKKSGGVTYSLSNDSEVTQSSEFKQWFGDWQNHPESASKVVNEDGTPKVVYHGTNADFNTFQSKDGAYWFSETRDYAEAMMEERKGSRIVEAYIDMKRPYRTTLHADQFSSPNFEAPIIRKAKSEGYDGVIIRNDTDNEYAADTFYVVFEPTQIKSATDNIGAFDGSNPDIRYSLSANNENVNGQFSISDKAYMEAVNRGDMETAQAMVNEAAEKAGYTDDTSWRMQHKAPNSVDDVSLVNLKESNLVPSDYWDHPEWYTHSWEERQSFHKVKEAIERQERMTAKGSKNKAGMWVYRAVDKTKNVHEDYFRNGDWVTPSYEYAVNEGKMNPNGYRIIKHSVPIENLYWDGNSIAELGYDDGNTYAYADTANNRKLLDPVTYDDDGNVIPLSKRFKRRNYDTRYSLSLEGEQGTQSDTYNVYGDGITRASRGGAVPIDSRLTYGSDIALEQDNDIPIRQDIAENANRNLDVQSQTDYNETRVAEDNGGISYARTDEFRRLQEESQGMDDTQKQLFRSGDQSLDEDLRGRLSGILSKQVESVCGRNGNADGLLKLNAKGNQFNVYENVNGELFHDVFETARNYLKNSELVDLHEANTTDDGIGYNDCTNYLSDDGLSGFSVTPDGDLISVFNASGKSGFLRAISDIVKQKAKTLDCYASSKQNLMGMYERAFGFKTASVMAYNMAYDHDNIAENHGMPQVAFMVNSEADVAERHFTKDQYSEAVDYRNSYVNNQISEKGKVSSTDGAFFDGENNGEAFLEWDGEYSDGIDGVDGIIFESRTEPKSPFDDRDIREVGSRKVNAYMYENPEVRPYFQEEAQEMLRELRNTVKGEKFFNDQLYYDTGGELGWFGTKRETSDAIAELLDKYGYSYSDIEKGLKAIIEDHGAENIAVSKRIEFFLDERLRNGYTDFMSGMEAPPNQDYISVLETKMSSENDTAGIPIRQDVSQTEPESDMPIRQDIPQAETESGMPIRDDIAETQDAGSARSGNALAQDTGEAGAMGPIRSDIHSESDTDGKGKMRKWVETATESEVVNREILPEDLDQELIHYEPVSNKKTLQQAEADLDRLGYDKALTVFKAKLETRNVSLSDIALGERLLQEAMKKSDTAAAADLIQDISILGTEMGQKVQALSIIQRLTPEGQLKMLYKLVERGKAKGDKAYSGVEVTQDIADKILGVYNEDGSYDQNELTEAVEEAKQAIADQMPVSRMEKANAWRYLSMLGNPKTHIRNVVSNVTMMAAVKAKNALARTMETAGRVKERTKTWRPATETVRQFAKQTTTEMAGILSGENSYSDTASMKSKRDVFKNKVLQKVYDFNSDMLTKEDWWFKRSAFQSAFREFLTANGIRTQEDINSHPETVEKAKKYAVEQAEIATFQQYSWLASKINDIERKNAATQAVVGSIIPFKKTPINIAKTGLSYSPLGFAKTLSYDLFQMKQGNMDASTVIDHLSQNMVGSALVYAGYMLAMSGLLNGGGEDDEEAKYDYQLGEQSYSINLGGATYSLSWLTPAAIPLFVGANVYEMFEEGKEFTFDTTADALAKTLDPMSEMSFLSSLDSVLSSYDSGMAKFAGIGEAMLQSYTSQFIPTLSSQIAATLDDTKRSTKASGDSTAEVPEETLRKLMYKIPGLRSLLEPSTDIWGNEVKQSDSLPARAFESFLAPYAKRENIGTEIDEELKKVYSQTGDGSLLPKVPSGSVTFDNEKYKMSASEYTAYKKTYGQTANKLLGELFATTAYRNADDLEKADMIGRVYDYAKDEAKKEYLAKEGVGYTNASKDGEAVYKEDKIKGAVENDMTLEEFELFSKSKGKYYISKALGGIKVYDPYVTEINAIKGDKDASGNTVSGSRKNKVADYINSLPLSREQKMLLFTSVYPGEDSYKQDIVRYLSSRDDISYSEMVEILEELDCRVTDDGKVYW